MSELFVLRTETSDTKFATTSGAGDKPAEAPAACGAPDKPEEKPAACGAADKPEEKPSACGA